MTVQESYENLGKLIEQGKGDLELIFRDCRSGYSGSVGIYTKPEVNTEQESMGRLCDEEIGYEYIPVYCDL